MSKEAILLEIVKCITYKSMYNRINYNLNSKMTNSKAPISNYYTIDKSEYYNIYANFICL
jgi:hypothetical protein